MTDPLGSSPDAAAAAAAGLTIWMHQHFSLHRHCFQYYLFKALFIIHNNKMKTYVSGKKTQKVVGLQIDGS